MTDPYEVLGIPSDADETEIRRRYLELVRQFPPDQAPERFTAIRAAYEEIRDPARRLQAQLFATSTNDSLDAIAAEIRTRLTGRRLPLDILLSLADET
jgi:curved DNA-binding protein CbpA